MIIHEINRLLEFGEYHHLIEKRDRVYCANLLLDVFQLSQFEEEDIKEELDRADDILDAMLAYAVENKLVEDTFTQKDLFDTRIMNCIMPRPSAVNEQFWTLYKQSSKCAMDYFYDLSILSNYVRKTRVEKDMKWKASSKYGELDITINLSKPEKDPKEIAMAKMIKASAYPKCAICKENEGFAGNIKQAARQNHRLIAITLNKENWFVQYSPYVYYNEHCIILNSEHKEMRIDHKAFSNLLEFLDMFPHYFVGSNADLPIVGGSILTHDHYQGGCYHMPLERAEVLKEYTLKQFPKIKLFHLNWPLSSIRLQGEDAKALALCADHILKTWQTYSDESVGIIAHSDQPHNTITPLARKKNGCYELDLVLRNNRTSEEHPLGIFHPHSDVHHIKKENIGVIEVAGFAILPARLKNELELIKKSMNNESLTQDESESIAKHEEWIAYLKDKRNMSDEDDMEFLKNEISIKFEKVLEDCGVFKMGEEGTLAFERFMKIL